VDIGMSVLEKSKESVELGRVCYSANLVISKLSVLFVQILLSPK